MKKRATLFKLIKILFLGAIATTPLFFLTSCSSEPSIKKASYDIMLGTTNINDFKSNAVKKQVINASAIALNAIGLNFNQTQDGFPILDNPPEDFVYFIGNSWMSGAGPYIDTSNRISFGLIGVKVNGSCENKTPSASDTSLKLDIQNVEFTYGFYDSNNGNKIAVSDALSRLQKWPDYQNKFTPKEYTATFNIQAVVNFKGKEGDSDWTIDTIEFKFESATGTAVKSPITSEQNINNLISDMSEMLKNNSRNNTEVHDKYAGLIKSIS